MIKKYRKDFRDRAQITRNTHTKRREWGHTFFAEVLTPAKSDPAPGSVIAIARICSPRHMAGKYLEEIDMI